MTAETQNSQRGRERDEEDKVGDGEDTVMSRGVLPGEDEERERTGRSSVADVDLPDSTAVA